MKQIKKFRTGISFLLMVAAMADGRAAILATTAVVVAFLYRDRLVTKVKTLTSTSKVSLAAGARAQWRSISYGAGLGLLLGAGIHHPVWLTAATAAGIVSTAATKKFRGTCPIWLGRFAAAAVMVPVLGWVIPMLAFGAGVAATFANRSPMAPGNESPSREQVTVAPESAAYNSQRPATQPWAVDTAQFDEIVERFHKD